MDGYLFYKQTYTNKSASFDHAGLAIADAITPKSSNHTLFIQRIVVNVNTPQNSTSITFDDDGAGPAIAVVPTTAAGVQEVDFGPEGVPLTQGANLDIGAAVDVAAKVYIEAYEKLTGVQSYLAGADVQ